MLGGYDDSADGQRSHCCRRPRGCQSVLLLGIATNLIRRQHRDEQRRLRLLAALGCERRPESAVETASPAVARALGQLHRRDRDVLVLYAVAELPYAEIAEALGIAEGTVRSRLNRARRILKETIDQ
jgi:RNA polymerase sigma-70 factor (ECF subfamily)